jgi:hypothetical protein
MISPYYACNTQHRAVIACFTLRPTGKPTSLPNSRKELLVSQSLVHAFCVCLSACLRACVRACVRAFIAYKRDVKRLITQYGSVCKSWLTIFRDIIDGLEHLTGYVHKVKIRGTHHYWQMYSHLVGAPTTRKFHYSHVCPFMLDIIIGWTGTNNRMLSWFDS